MKNTLAPSWEVEYPLNLTSKDSNININLYDWDKFSKHESLGNVSINVSELISKTSNGPKWFELKDCKSGSILLSLRMDGDMLASQEPKSSLKGIFYS